MEEFKKEFDKRHDFNSTELNVLKDNFPHVGFYNIPEAWIIIVDKMLRKISNDVSYVSQEYGFLRVVLKGSKENDFNYISKQMDVAQKRVRAIDKDLHDLMDYDIVI